MARRDDGSGWALAAVISLVSAVLFAVVGGWRFGYGLKEVGMLAASGAMIGAMMGPECEPRAFRYPALWQAAFGITGCVLIAVILEAGPAGYGLAVVGGALLGFTAPWWVKHAQLP